MKDKPRIVVIVKDGLVQEVLSDNPVDVLKLDLDVEGSCEDETIPLTKRIEKLIGYEDDRNEVRSFVQFMDARQLDARQVSEIYNHAENEP